MIHDFSIFFGGLLECISFAHVSHTEAFDQGMCTSPECAQDYSRHGPLEQLGPLGGSAGSAGSSSFRN